MKNWLRAAGHALWRLAPAFACLLIYALLFLLYGLPREPYEYGLLLCAVLLLVWWGVSTVLMATRTNAVDHVTETVPDAPLPLPRTIGPCEAAYQRLYAAQCGAYEARAGQTRRRDQERDDYYSMWVHQIKTPISALRLLLGEEADSRAAAMGRELGQIERYAELALAYQRMESFHEDLAFERCSLKAIAQTAIKKLAPQMIYKRLTVALEIGDEQVLTDEKWLLLVLEQILSNAVKYTQVGGVTLRMENGDTLTLTDTGIGIQPEDVPRVFERGFTGRNGREYQKSTGIGLYLCKLVCDRLHIKLSITSQPEQGTSVTLAFPREDWEELC